MLQSVSRLCAVNLLPKILPLSLPRYENYSKWRTLDANSDQRITLISTDENVDITSLSEATEKATANNLKLVKITDFDVKTRRPVYRLMENIQYQEERLKERQLKKEAKKQFSIKGLKTIILTSCIGDHDLQTKCKNISKWLQKQYEVKVTIQKSDHASSSEKLYSRIVGEIKEKFKVQQKVLKETSMKFYLQPLPPVEGDPNTPKVENNEANTAIDNSQKENQEKHSEKL